MGEFNDWQDWEMYHSYNEHFWEVNVPQAKAGQRYLYRIWHDDGNYTEHCDPYGYGMDVRPAFCSVIRDLSEYQFHDSAWMHQRTDCKDRPLHIYEIHCGSWQQKKKNPDDEQGEWYNYEELANLLIPYVKKMGYNYIELMPIAEHPADESWGYQNTGFFAPTSRYGTASQLKYFVDKCHQNGIGVLLDFVPVHFAIDSYGLSKFDGMPLYEYPDTSVGISEWGSYNFIHSKGEVQSFLQSNACYWLKEFHFDGLRVDAVSCMLYLDYGRNDGEWLPNIYGGRENLDAIALFKKIHEAIKDIPGSKIMIAEESTAFPCVTDRHGDSLGFDYKWNMGWMNDILNYMHMDSLYRKWHHDKLTFSLMYAFSEHYILPFSHDEVVHGKLSMLNKMPGDYWQKFAQLRLLYAYQIAHPGKKLTFMGMEIGQFIEWRFDESLDWMLLDYPKHSEMQCFVREVNKFYRRTPALYQRDNDWDGFDWIAVDDAVHSIAAFVRKNEKGEIMLCAFNFTPVPWDDYCLGSEQPGTYEEVFSTDAPYFGGAGLHYNKPTHTVEEPFNKFRYRIHVKLPPYGAVFFRFKPTKHHR